MRALKTLFHTFPLSVAYLLYMVTILLNKPDNNFCCCLNPSNSNSLITFFFVQCVSPEKLASMASVRGVNVPMYTQGRTQLHGYGVMCPLLFFIFSLIVKVYLVTILNLEKIMQKCP